MHKSHTVPGIEASTPDAVKFCCKQNYGNGVLRKARPGTQNISNLIKIKYLIIVIILLGFSSVKIFSQTPLQKNISVKLNNQKLSNVLEILSNTGNFYFSYNSKIIKKDSLVNVNFNNATIKEILTYLFTTQYEFIESGNYIILRKKPISTNAIVKQTITEEKAYYITGYVVDYATGEMLSNVSIFEAKNLASGFTNKEGFFKIKLKSKYPTATITISKEDYNDTSFNVQPKLNQQLVVSIKSEKELSYVETIKPQNFSMPDTVKIEFPIGYQYLYVKVDSTKKDTFKVQKTWLGKLFISTKQQIQSANLKKFFATRNFQLSFVPGISTQGELSAQVTSDYSLNVLGGYTRSIKKVEVGGLFNINKKDAQYFQMAGLFNAVGGSFKGLQVAGIHNMVLDSLTGLQVSGITNFVKTKVNGMQIAGIYNHVKDSVKGLQISGIANYTTKTTGWQVAGIANISKQSIKGVQLAGIVNYTKHLKGLQIGLINIADSSNGYSIGLINFVKHGYHKLSVYTNEVTNVNIAYKAGNKKLYSILNAGATYTKNKKLYSYGYGVGNEATLFKKTTLNTELTANKIYAGTWKNTQSKLALSIQWQPLKGISLFAGPSISIFSSNQKTAVSGYQFPIPSTAYNTFKMGNSIGWIGYSAGISLF